MPSTAPPTEATIFDRPLSALNLATAEHRREARECVEPEILCDLWSVKTAQLKDTRRWSTPLLHTASSTVRSDGAIRSGSFRPDRRTSVQDIAEDEHRRQARKYVDPEILCDLWSVTRAQLQDARRKSTPLLHGATSTAAFDGVSTPSNTGVPPGSGKSGFNIIAPRMDATLQALCNDPESAKHVAVAEKGQVRYFS
jgi:hypothetical protein